MVTKEQLRALKRVYDRQDLTMVWQNGHVAAARWENYEPSRPIMSYREFRKIAVEGFDCLMVPWCGMWLGIEKDGYTHS